jgi:hypothetical protein
MPNTEMWRSKALIDSSRVLLESHVMHYIWFVIHNAVLCSKLGVQDKNYPTAAID